MDDAGSKPASKEPISPGGERRLSGIVAELAGILKDAKIDPQDYEEHLIQKYS